MSNLKIQFSRTIPECATFAEIPKGTPAFKLGVRKHPLEREHQIKLEAQGETWVRIHTSRVGYVGNEWLFLAVPTDAIEERN